MEQQTDQLERRAASAVFLVELERFSRTVEALGDTAVELVRTEMTRRVHEVVPVSGSIARTGPDEFAVVVSDVTRADARQIADRLHTTLRGEIEIPGGGVSYMVAVGVVLTDGPSGELDDTLVRRARRAVREARASDVGVHVAELTTGEG